jgi:hypothetical protein
MEVLVYLALIVLIVSIGIFYRFYPRMPAYRNRYEGFSSPAVAPAEPKCLQRNLDALTILRILPPCGDPHNTPTEDATDREELALILQKLTCLESDVANNGVSGYNTLALPYNTSHDAEPLPNFVGRCLNNGTRSRDLEIVIEKYDKRGKTLIHQITKRNGMDAGALLDNYEAVVRTTMKTLVDNCLAKQSNLDRPYGPRDPGFAVPYAVERLASY